LVPCGHLGLEGVGLRPILLPWFIQKSILFLLLILIIWYLCFDCDLVLRRKRKKRMMMMEKLEKEDKKENKTVGVEPMPVRVPTFQDLLQVIQSNSNASAKKALETLVKRGCDQNTVIELVYLYCRGASPNETKKALKAGPESLKRWTKLCERLLEDADQIESVIAELDQKRLATSYYPENHHPAEEVREFAHYLAALGGSLKAGVTAKSGSNETLVYLCYLVKAATGREHYPKIAALIRAFQQSEKHLDQGADAIRNRVTRYTEAHAITRRGRTRIPLREQAEDEVAEWQESRPPKKESPRGRRKKKTL
jgi:hypothetical protein